MVTAVEQVKIMDRNAKFVRICYIKCHGSEIRKWKKEKMQLDIGSESTLRFAYVTWKGLHIDTLKLLFTVQ